MQDLGTTVETEPLSESTKVEMHAISSGPSFMDCVWLVIAFGSIFAALAAEPMKRLYEMFSN